MTTRRPWTRDKLLIAFRLYCGTPFGKLHQHNPEIIATARLLDRTPSAVGMKACNFASLDPVQQTRNISALGNTSRADRELWNEFTTNAESLAAEAEATWESVAVADAASVRSEPDNAATPREATRTLPASGSLTAVEPPAGPTETEHPVRVRRVQRFFRAAVLSSYGHRCALSGIPLPELLNASHILPWSESIPRRADPRNGLALHALYDRAFDRGYLSFDENLRVVRSPLLRIDNPPPLHTATLLSLEGRPLTLPDRWPADREALAWHREVVFRR